MVDGKPTYLKRFVFHTPGATHCKVSLLASHQPACIGGLPARSPTHYSIILSHVFHMSTGDGIRNVPDQQAP
eukprot:480534-Prymnesium_polylepis.2